MRNPKVSIIIAAYNAGPTIEKALCSVEKQSFQDWECLIIDGIPVGGIKIIDKFI